MKKLIILIILAITAVSCSLLDNEAYQEMKREESEKGVKCYRTSSGYAYCEDKYGNRVY
jgi:hypothetical protein